MKLQNIKQINQYGRDINSPIIYMLNFFSEKSLNSLRGSCSPVKGKNNYMQSIGKSMALTHNTSSPDSVCCDKEKTLTSRVFCPPWEKKENTETYKSSWWNDLSCLNLRADSKGHQLGGHWKQRHQFRLYHIQFRLYHTPQSLHLAQCEISRRKYPQFLASPWEYKELDRASCVLAFGGDCQRNYFCFTCFIKLTGSSILGEEKKDEGTCCCSRGSIV